jgi:hypothetical protein
MLLGTKVQSQKSLAVVPLVFSVPFVKLRTVKVGVSTSRPLWSIYGKLFLLIAGIIAVELKFGGENDCRMVRTLSPRLI